MDEDKKYWFLVTATRSDMKQVTHLVRASCISKALEGFLKCFQGSRDIRKLEADLTSPINENGKFIE